MRPNIIGVCLVKDEDIYIHRALTNIYGFCDRILVLDNNSTDKTRIIVESLAEINTKK